MATSGRVDFSTLSSRPGNVGRNFLVWVDTPRSRDQGDFCFVSMIFGSNPGIAFGKPDLFGLAGCDYTRKLFAGQPAWRLLPWRRCCAGGGMPARWSGEYSLGPWSMWYARAACR